MKVSELVDLLLAHGPNDEVLVYGGPEDPSEPRIVWEDLRVIEIDGWLPGSGWFLSISPLSARGEVAREIQLRALVAMEREIRERAELEEYNRLRAKFEPELGEFSIDGAMAAGLERCPVCRQRPCECE